jgi:hypothetical protein
VARPHPQTVLLKAQTVHLRNRSKCSKAEMPETVVAPVDKVSSWDLVGVQTLALTWTIPTMMTLMTMKFRTEDHMGVVFRGSQCQAPHQEQVRQTPVLWWEDLRLQRTRQLGLITTPRVRQSRHKKLGIDHSRNRLRKGDRKIRTKRQTLQFARL